MSWQWLQVCGQHASASRGCKTLANIPSSAPHDAAKVQSWESVALAFDGASAMANTHEYVIMCAQRNLQEDVLTSLARLQAEQSTLHGLVCVFSSPGFVAKGEASPRQGRGPSTLEKCHCVHLPLRRRHRERRPRAPAGHRDLAVSTCRPLRCLLGITGLPQPTPCTRGVLAGAGALGSMFATVRVLLRVGGSPDTCGRTGLQCDAWRVPPTACGRVGLDCGSRGLHKMPAGMLA